MKRLMVALILILTLLLPTCAPKPAPPPASTTPKGPATTSVAPAPTASKLSPEQTEWQKVVEAAQKEGKVTLYGVNIIGDAAIQVIKAFKERYNVDVEIVSGKGAEFTERLKTERRMGSMVGDVVQVAPSFVLIMKNLDLLEVAPGLPSLRNKGDFRVNPLLDKDGYIFSFRISLMIPLVNTKLVRPGEEPKSWQDMLNPKWKGKMLAPSPLTTVGIYMAFIPLLNAKAITLEWLRDIGKQDIIFTRSDPETAQKLSQGEYPLALEIADSTVSPYTKQGAPIKTIPMAEGLSGSTGTIAQVKNGPHPNAAQLFLNWILSEEGQTIFHKSQGSYSVRKDVPDFRPQALVFPPATKIVLETPSDLEDYTKKFQDKWLIDLWGK